MNRRLWETDNADLDVIAFATELYASWPEGIRTNMVMSLDGAVTFHGRVGPLSSSVDRALFHALRALSDVVLVGAGTARAEGYGPVELSEQLVALRANHGPWASAVPRLAIVTTSCRLPPRCLDAPPSERPIVITSRQADTAQIRDHVDLIVAGTDDVDLPTSVNRLHDLGMRRILCEGGPSLIDRLAEADLVDDLCVTLTSQLAAEPRPATTTRSPLEKPQRFRLQHAVAHGTDVFLRYRR